MESSNSGSFQSDNEHEYDDSNNNFTQSQSVSSASAVANNFLINNNNNNNPTTNNSFNHHQLLEQASTFYNHLHPPVQVQVQVQPTSSLLSSIQDPSWSQTIPTCTFTLQNPSTTDAAHHIGVVKNPKKRTRASRRAPTTVLTTDTTNFRQMVQEFTGIPTAPFTRRLRPKIQSPLAFLNNNNNNNNNIVAESSTSINNTTTSNYNFSPSNITNFQKQPSTFLDLQQNSPMFSFQSLILQNSWGEEFPRGHE